MSKAKPEIPLIINQSEMEKQEKIFLTIQEKTGLSDQRVRNHYAQFIKTCPNGAMTKKKFVDLSKAALGEKIVFLSDSLFRVYDENGDGIMDFTEYMLAINAASLNTPEDKLKWMFDVFDKDGGGTISPDEIEALLKDLFVMSGQKFEYEELEEACKDIMDAIDTDGDGEVTKKEFINNAMKSQFIAGMLS